MMRISKIEFYIRRNILKLPQHTLLVLICILIGIVAGVSAFLLKSVFHYIHYLIHVSENVNVSNTLLVVLPITGLLLTVGYVSIFHKQGLKKGISQILYSIKHNSSYIERNQTYGHIISSSLTIGFGGSAGFEAPIVATGSAIGSNIGRYFKFVDHDRALLLASGAAAGISAIFNAPIAGVLFAIEVLLPQVFVSAFIPLLLSSASAAIVSGILYKDQLFVLITNGWKLNALPIYIVLGILAGLYSVFIIRQTIYVDHLVKKIKSKWLRAIFGGMVLSVIILVFPSLYGEGYFTIQSILNSEKLTLVNIDLFSFNSSNVLFITVIAVLFIKTFATSITISSGGNGGIFAPSLFMGGLLGFLIATGLNASGLTNLNVINFTVVGMAGVLSGVIKIPLTSVFLIAEITGGYVLFVPLMIVSAISYFISSYFENKSIYSKELEMRS